MVKMSWWIFIYYCLCGLVCRGLCGEVREPTKFEPLVPKFEVEDALDCRNYCCIDYQACRGAFKVYFVSGSSAEERSLIHQKCIRNDTGAWYESELATTDLSEACLVFVSIGHGIQHTTDCFTQISSLPSWNTFGEQGRNHVIWSASDD